MNEITRDRIVRLRMIIPLLGIVLGLFLLMGCIYIPIPEHSTNWTKKDFRPYIAAENNSSPIQRGRTTRVQIIQLLGKPQFEIPDGHGLVYKYNTARDFVIWPLCFLAQPEYQDSFAVKFTFDAHDILLDWETAHDQGRHYGGGAIQSPVLTYGDATLRFQPGYKDAATTQP